MNSITHFLTSLTLSQVPVLPPAKLLSTLDTLIAGLQTLDKSFIDRWKPIVVECQSAYQYSLSESDQRQLKYTSAFFDTIQQLNQRPFTKQCIANLVLAYREFLKNPAASHEFGQFIEMALRIQEMIQELSDNSIPLPTHITPSGFIELLELMLQDCIDLDEPFIDDCRQKLLHYQIAHCGRMDAPIETKFQCSLLLFNTLKKIKIRQSKIPFADPINKYISFLKNQTNTKDFELYLNDLDVSLQQISARKPIEDVDITCAIKEFNLRQEFPLDVLEAASAITDHLSESDLRTRIDLSKDDIFTIDPDNAKDYDDALSIKKTLFGYIVRVHISDVSHYIKRGSALDKEARLRGNSVYFLGKCLSMLPPRLADDICSLLPNKDRLTITFELYYDTKGTRLDSLIYRSIIKSKKRFTYKEVKAVLDGKMESQFLPQLKMMAELATVLRQKRKQEGSFDFSRPESVIKLDENGQPDGFEIIDYDITHQLVEEFMLEANEVLATTLADKGKIFPYRVHKEPDIRKIDEFCQIARSLGFTIPPCPTSAQLSALFTDAKVGEFLSHQYCLRMPKAYYDIENWGHYGLGKMFYTHATSPIRRYSDIEAHRSLFDENAKPDHLEEVVYHISETEKNADKAEKFVKKLKKVRYAEKCFKENPHEEYSSVVTNIKPTGFRFRVKKLEVEEDMDLQLGIGSKWKYDSIRRKFLEQGTCCEIALGTQCDARISGIDKASKKISWILQFKRLPNQL